MKNSEVARAFASGATSGENASMTLYIRGQSIYSYRNDWPLATKTDIEEATLNIAQYSNTTSHHRELVRRAMETLGWVLREVSLEEAIKTDREFNR